MKYKCVIFDCDGVLVDSERISAKVLVDMALESGLSIDMDDAIERFTGKSFRSILSYIEQQIDVELKDNFETEFRRRTYKLFEKELQPVDGIKDVLKKISVPFCVASSGPRKKIKINLAKTQLINKFPEQNIFSSFDIGSWKPEPEIYLHAANKMGFKPNECAVIEDSIYGVKAAISGGFDVFVYTNKKRESAFNGLNVIVFDDMLKLLSLIKE